MKKILAILLYFIFSNKTIAQKETIFLFFDKTSNKKCNVEVEFSSDNDSKLDGYSLFKKFSKKTNGKKTTFFICDERFIFKHEKQAIDTCSVKSIKKINFKTINYIKDKYHNGKDFKHHTFKQINIVEKISETKIVKYYNVYWCCEWKLNNLIKKLF